MLLDQHEIRNLPAPSDHPAGTGSRSAVMRPALGLALILTAWLWWFRHSHPEVMFGQYHDDTMLLGSAEALAAGRGFVIPSIPAPQGLAAVQTKYPIFYPWLLSLVWTPGADFLVNLRAALHVSAAFACLALLAAYFLLRDLGIGINLALLMTAFCAFEPIFLVLSTKVLTDVPMMALTLAAALFAERALKPEAPRWLAAAAGLLAAAAVLTRTIGVTIPAAFLAVALWRRRYRAAAAFLAACAPLVLLGMLAPGDNRALEPWARQGGPGFRGVWMYYTSYLAYWKDSVPGLRAFLWLAAENVLMFWIAVAMYFQFPLVAGYHAYAYIAVSAGILAGVVRHARRHGWKVIHLIFLLHTGIILSWTNREMVERFFLLFLPLFCLGFAVEARRLAELAWRTMRGRRPAPEKPLAAALLAGLALFQVRGTVAAAAYNRSFLQTVIPRTAALNREKDELYAWIEGHTGASARFIAWDDGGLYLRTGRQGMRAITLSTQYCYTRDAALLDQEMRRLFDTARFIQARYWVRVDGEFADRQFEQRVNRALSPLPVVFQSSGGRVRVYDIAASGRASLRATNRF
jgi:hypothetical protein